MNERRSAVKEANQNDNPNLVKCYSAQCSAVIGAMSKSETGEEFQKRYNEIVKHGFTTLCLSLGQKLKLFDHVTDVPRTSEEIANSSGYRERYVREWLNGMVVSDMIEVNDQGDKYWLPSQRSILLSDNGQLSLFFPVFSGVFDQIIECFKKEGPRGLPYSAYKDFHETISNNNNKLRTKTVEGFFSSIAGLANKLETGITCLDVGCGIGIPSFTLAKQYKNSVCFGIDFVQSAIDSANKLKAENNLNNLHYYAYDAGKLPSDWSNKFEYITAFDAIHDQAYPDKALAEIFRVLKPGGQFSMIDIDTHTNVSMNKSVRMKEFLYTASLFHCMPVSLYFDGGMGLGTCWGREKALAMLSEAGFVDVVFEDEPVEESFNYHCISKKP